MATHLTPTDRDFISPACDGILGAVGHTPLVRLRRIVPDGSLEIYAKLEASNPGASAKDRPAAHMIREAIRRGDITRGTTVVESTSGNLGVGLAQACRFFGLPLICVTDARTSEWNRRRMEALGAEVRVVTHPDPATGELLPARLALVEEIVRAVPGAFRPGQYSNLDNPAAHRDGTMSEITRALDGNVDYVFVATSTTGTLRGCWDYLRSAGLPTKVVAVDAFGSALFGGTRGPRRLPGLGAGMQPKLSRDARFDDLVRVTDLDCVVGCRRLARREAILAGASSGGVVAALALRASEIPSGSVCALIFPDGASSYLSTVYDDGWVERELDCDPDTLGSAIEDDATPVPPSASRPAGRFP
jgi:N-(2-amino-2-carboxyethyl)-L-glutamate synthase